MALSLVDLFVYQGTSPEDRENDAQYHVVANDGDKFAFLTSRNAPKNKLILDTRQIACVLNAAHHPETSHRRFTKPNLN
ncbi:hypothetical protein OsJ_14523 [Oryza sativa Japonica Group]|uniref:OSJNBb0089B03.15 protein n=1 Tax=Oryza sativa subsp. japonica TaxID=39947 RepID=Q7XNP6_ORYSJ|nr:hypothetical protein OsJ_14523 [Oryza sativa Japonica Group]CAE04001.1 OSJNBb0089B03.15 [Oryza sativa Japonica Group]